MVVSRAARYVGISPYTLFIMANRGNFPLITGRARCKMNAEMWSKVTQEQYKELKKIASRTRVVPKKPHAWREFVAKNVDTLVNDNKSGSKKRNGLKILAKEYQKLKKEKKIPVYAQKLNEIIDKNNPPKRQGQGLMKLRKRHPVASAQH